MHRVFALFQKTRSKKPANVPQIPLFVLLLLGLASPRANAAQPLRWGMGVLLGEPLGVTAQFYLTERWATEFGIGYSWLSQARVWTDVIYHLPIRTASKALTVHAVFGLGVRFFFSAGPFEAKGVGSGIGLGARIPIGVETCLAEYPFCTGIFFSPGVGILPFWSFAPEGALTLRWVLREN